MRAQFKAEQHLYHPFKAGEVVFIEYHSTSRVEAWPTSIRNIDLDELRCGTVVKVGRKGSMVIVEAEVPPELQ